MDIVVTITLVIAALIHLGPVVGVLGSRTLEKTYGITLGDPNTTILMRHRAVLFGIVGAFMLVAAFMPAYQPAAFAMGLVSAVSYMALVWFTPGHNERIWKVFTVDIVALIALLVGSLVITFS